MRLLDLFCGAGGAAMGYHRAGFDEIVGIDIKPQKRYPFAFIQADALDPPVDLADFDLVHASPPCQGYSRLRHLPWLKDHTWPMLITPMQEILRGFPHVIENVMDAPLEGIFLCAQMFDLPMFRHRRFEASWSLSQPEHEKHIRVIGHGRRVNDRRKGTLNAGSKGTWATGGVITVAGGQFRKADGERAMGIDWMLKRELADAIPPAYTEYIGRQFLAQR